MGAGSRPLPFAALLVVALVLSLMPPLLLLLLPPCTDCWPLLLGNWGAIFWDAAALLLGVECGLRAAACAGGPPGGRRALLWLPGGLLAVAATVLPTRLLFVLLTPGGTLSVRSVAAALMAFAAGALGAALLRRPLLAVAFGYFVGAVAAEAGYDLWLACGGSIADADRTELPALLALLGAAALSARARRPLVRCLFAAAAAALVWLLLLALFRVLG